MIRNALTLCARPTLVLALVATGCTCKHHDDEHLSKESPASLKIDPPDDLDLPHSSSSEALPPEAIPIYVSRSRIFVGFDRREVAVLGDRETSKIAGVPAKYKSVDQSVTVVVDAVDAVRKERKLGDWIPAVIAVDASIPFHVVGDVVLTVQKARFDRYALVVKRDDGSLAAIGMGKGHLPTDAPPPAPAGPDAAVPSDAPIYLGVRVLDDGYMVRAFNREVGPDCTSATFGTTVPKKNGVFDLAGLTHCAEVIRARVPGSPDKFVTVSVGPAIAFSDAVRAIDALRAGGDGKPLFPDVGLVVVH
jgi:hypothetical protein